MKTAVVLFNLGGPDSPDAVQPFLRNLFSDPAIIALPQPLRWLLAKLISSRRAPVAQAIYAKIGGRSPILEQTQAQAKALEDALTASATRSTGDYRVFIAMRYWHPFARETAAEVAAFAPDQVILLPLYSQYSSTTSGSSADDWRRAAEAAGLKTPTKLICCYPAVPAYVKALTDQVAAAIDEAKQRRRRFRLLFSAHGLPEKVIAGGDPYQFQVERTAAAIVAALGERAKGLDWRVCYQSRVGPLKWIGPATDYEVRTAGAEGTGLIVLPIAFVSEHSETLVELDMEYRELAERAGVPFYNRIPALGTDPGYISALASLCGEAGASSAPFVAGVGQRVCPPSCGRCPLHVTPT